MVDRVTYTMFFAFTDSQIPNLLEHMILNANVVAVIVPLCVSNHICGSSQVVSNIRARKMFPNHMRYQSTMHKICVQCTKFGQRRQTFDIFLLLDSGSATAFARRVI